MVIALEALLGALAPKVTLLDNKAEVMIKVHFFTLLNKESKDTLFSSHPVEISW